MVQERNYEKSTRHNMVIGNLGERLVCNWLSRKGFEVAVVDHTGIDLIARNSVNNELMGISVKARARNSEESENSCVNLFDVENDDINKTRSACTAFGCVAWVAVYIEAKNYADIYMTPLDNYWEKYCNQTAKSNLTWKVTKKWLRLYEADEKVHHLHFTLEVKRWFS